MKKNYNLKIDFIEIKNSSFSIFELSISDPLNLISPISKTGFANTFDLIDFKNETKDNIEFNFIEEIFINNQINIDSLLEHKITSEQFYFSLQDFNINKYKENKDENIKLLQYGSNCEVLDIFGKCIYFDLSLSFKENNHSKKTGVYSLINEINNNSEKLKNFIISKSCIDEDIVNYQVQDFDNYNRAFQYSKKYLDLFQIPKNNIENLEYLFLILLEKINLQINFNLNDLVGGNLYSANKKLAETIILQERLDESLSETNNKTKKLKL